MSHETDIAWAAGIWDGEGCWSVTSRAGDGHHKGSMHAQSRLGMTDRDVVERFAAIVGFGTVRLRANQKEAKYGPRKPVWEWYTQRRDMTRQLIEMFWPYLGERRRAKAQEVLDLGEATPAAERLTCPRGHPYDLYESVGAKSRGSHMARRCSVCRNKGSRDRARVRLNIPPERWRVAA